MIEAWRSIPGYEGSYEASNLGRIRSIDRVTINSQTNGGSRRRRGKIIKMWGIGRKRNYFAVMLSKGGIKTIRPVHQLVLETFVGPRPPGHQACHLNDDQENNRLDNLYWGSIEENTSDKIKNGKTMKGECNPASKLNDQLVREMRSIMDSGKSAYATAKSFGVSKRTALLIRDRIYWSHV